MHSQTTNVSSICWKIESAQFSPEIYTIQSNTMVVELTTWPFPIGRNVFDSSSCIIKYFSTIYLAILITSSAVNECVSRQNFTGFRLILIRWMRIHWHDSELLLNVFCYRLHFKC